MSENISPRRYGFTLRDPRAVLLLLPFQLPFVISMLIISVIFTVAPNALSHTAVAFETRGIVHHVWHYTLLIGSALALYGMMSARSRRLLCEMWGLALLFAAIAFNLTAVIADGVGGEGVVGLTVAFRSAALFGLLVRLYILFARPAVDLPASSAPVARGLDGS